MRTPRRSGTVSWWGAGLLVLFGISFGYVEAAVVVYLRALTKFHGNDVIARYHVYWNLGFIEFVKPAHALLVSHRIADIEVARESATIAMLLLLALLAGANTLQRAGAFLIGFSCWDLSYYGWLRLLDHWPQNFFTRDVFFLIPVAWIGPVLTPLIASTLLLLVGWWLYTKGSGRRRSSPYW